MRRVFQRRDSPYEEHSLGDLLIYGIENSNYKLHIPKSLKLFLGFRLANA